MPDSAAIQTCASPSGHHRQDIQKLVKIEGGSVTNFHLSLKAGCMLQAAKCGGNVWMWASNRPELESSCTLEPLWASESLSELRASPCTFLRVAFSTLKKCKPTLIEMQIQSCKSGAGLQCRVSSKLPVLPTLLTRAATEGRFKFSTNLLCT